MDSEETKAPTSTALSSIDTLPSRTVVQRSRAYRAISLLESKRADLEKHYHASILECALPLNMLMHGEKNPNTINTRQCVLKQYNPCTIAYNATVQTPWNASNPLYALWRPRNKIREQGAEQNNQHQIFFLFCRWFCWWNILGSSLRLFGAAAAPAPCGVGRSFGAWNC